MDTVMQNATEPELVVEVLRALPHARSLEDAKTRLQRAERAFLVEGLQLRIEGFRFQDQGVRSSGFRVEVSGLRVEGLRQRERTHHVLAQAFQTLTP